MTMIDLRELAKRLDDKTPGSMHVLNLRMFSDGSGSISAFDTSSEIEVLNFQFENEDELNDFLYGKFPAVEASLKKLSGEIAKEVENGFDDSILLTVAKKLRSHITEANEAENYPSLDIFIYEENARLERIKAENS